MRPLACISLIKSSNFKSGVLVSISSEFQTPTVKDLEVNEVWLEPCAKLNPLHVPSAYYLGDALLLLDNMLGGKLRSSKSWCIYFFLLPCIWLGPALYSLLSWCGFPGGWFRRLSKAESTTRHVNKTYPELTK